MTDRDLKINTRLMNEFNLEPGSGNRIFDRETGELYRINGKEVLVPGSPAVRHAAEFDPINSIRQMNYLFGTYVSSLQQQGVIEGDIISYGTIGASYPGTVRAVLKVQDWDTKEITETTSKAYRNETSAYADLVCQINESDDTDMSEYDIDRQKQAEQQRKAAQKQMKFKQPKKGGKNEKRKT